jgi:hypothetical protein
MGLRYPNLCAGRKWGQEVRQLNSAQQQPQQKDAVPIVAALMDRAENG